MFTNPPFAILNPAKADSSPPLPPTHRRLLVGRGRGLHADPEELARLLALPRDPLVQGMFHPDGAGNRAVFHAYAAKPAFVRVNRNRRRTADEAASALLLDILPEETRLEFDKALLSHFCFNRR